MRFTGGMNVGHTAAGLSDVFRIRSGLWEGGRWWFEEVVVMVAVMVVIV